MDITALAVVLSVVVIVAALFLTASNEPPLWVFPLACLSAWPLSSALFGMPAFASTVGNSAPAEWVVRLAVASVLTAALSFFADGERRTGDTEDDDPTDGPAAPRRTVAAAGDVPAGGTGA
ncbi:hypothetical protein ACWD7F_23410 [Streptomyces sp. NPDC005122]